jgi:hypothetical protein
MLKHLWSHTRDIRVVVYKNKVTYDIPLYNDLLFKNHIVDYKFNSLILTTFNEPTEKDFVIESQRYCCPRK